MYRMCADIIHVYQYYVVWLGVSVPPSADVDGCVLHNSTTGSRPGSGSGCGLLIPLSSVEP